MNCHICLGKNEEFQPTGIPIHLYVLLISPGLLLVMLGYVFAVPFLDGDQISLSVVM